MLLQDRILLKWDEQICVFSGVKGRLLALSQMWERKGKSIIEL